MCCKTGHILSPATVNAVKVDIYCRHRNGTIIGDRGKVPKRV